MHINHSKYFLKHRLQDIRGTVKRTAVIKLQLAAQLSLYLLDESFHL